jgi:hypothetical protein
MELLPLSLTAVSKAIAGWLRRNPVFPDSISSSQKMVASDDIGKSGNITIMTEKSKKGRIFLVDIG